jgi:DNA-directed RNA polymerase subunit M/transcription elongation factor TFIIS
MATSDLKFCKNCSNMLYYKEKTDSDGSILLTEFCKRCGYETEPSGISVFNERGTAASAAAAGDDSGRTPEIIVYEKSYEQGYIQPQVDKVAFGDPAVPTTKEIVCVNSTCPSRTDGGPEPSAKFIVLNPDTYSIMYYCVHCEAVWRNAN